MKSSIKWITSLSIRVVGVVVAPLARLVLNFALGKFRLFVLYRSGSAIGDHLCATAVVQALLEQHGLKSIVLTSYPEFFKNNPAVIYVLNLKSFPPLANALVQRTIMALRGCNVGEFRYRDKVSQESYLRDSKRDIHLISLHATGVSRPLNLEQAVPRLFLADSEMKTFRRDFPDLPNEYAIVQSQGKTDYTPNKEWGPDRMQQVVQLVPDIRWVQAGGLNDVPLVGAIDMRGKTRSLRSLAALIAGARLVVSVEGLYNHMAAAFDVPAFVVFSGFSKPSLAAYRNTRPIVRVPQVACSPCYLCTPCPVPGKPCTNDINPTDVSNEIRRFWGQETT